MKAAIFALIFVGILLTGCVQNPGFKSASVEPNFLRSTYDDRSTIVYSIKNPSQIDFQGKVTMIYDDDCLSISSSKRDVVVEKQQTQAYSVDVTLSRRTSLENKCYQAQNILLKLSDQSEKTLYDTKEIALTVTR